MTQFRKKPVVIDAFHWTGTNGNALLDWVTAFGPNTSGTELGVDFATSEVTIQTKEGLMRGTPGDWIIRGVQGEYYPCKPDIFEMTYEPATQAAPQPPVELRAATYEEQYTPAIRAMAKKQYMAYCENSGNKNFRGEECPAWEALPREIRSHWCAATTSALPHLNVQ